MIQLLVFETKERKKKKKSGLRWEEGGCGWLLGGC